MQYVQRSFFDSVVDLLSHIYTDSQYNPDCDLFRMKDILDSVSAGQFSSKLWLANELRPYITKDHDGIQIIGGWYGLMAHILADNGFTKEIKNYDLDPICEEYGYRLSQYGNVHFVTKDGLTIYDDEYVTNVSDKITICTACEHIDRLTIETALRKKHHRQVVALQSNNYFEIDSHVNCHDSVEHFIDTLPLKEILYSGTKSWRNEYDRFLVIGK